MSDPVIDRLLRFTPTDRLDRDDLLFRAGRASAPSRRPWIGLSALLAVMQVVILAVWFTRPRPVVIVEWSVPAEVVSPEPDPPVRQPFTLQSVWSDPALR
jgi:hypothetical protein